MNRARSIALSPISFPVVLLAVFALLALSGAPAVAQGGEDDLLEFESHLTTEELGLGRAQQLTTCTPQRIAVFPTRIHVKCTTPAPGGIYFFALPVNDPAKAARFLTILTAAYVMGRDLDVWYDPNDLSGAAIGCATSDCRVMIGVGAA